MLSCAAASAACLVNSTNICASPPEATVKALGQNNRGVIFRSKLRGRCGHEKRAKHGHRHRRRKHK